jgi:hypothetical protein
MSDLDQAQIRCPYCGEHIDIQVHIGSHDEDYVEDCSVCCRPILLHVTRDEDGIPSVSASCESD